MLKHWLPLLCWMSIIFIGSTDLLSSQNTARFIGPLLRWINPNVTDETIRFVQVIVRKGGHTTEYAVLAALAWRALRPLMLATQPWCWRTAALALLIATLYAVTDEYHQSLIATRLGSGWDVLIDSAGAVLGLAIVRAWIQWRLRRSTHSSTLPSHSASLS